MITPSRWSMSRGYPVNNRYSLIQFLLSSLITVMCTVHTRGRVCLFSISHPGLHVAMDTFTLPYSPKHAALSLPGLYPVSSSVAVTELSLLTKWLPTPKPWNCQVQHLNLVQVQHLIWSEPKVYLPSWFSSIPLIMTSVYSLAQSTKV